MLSFEHSPLATFFYLFLYFVLVLVLRARARAGADRRELSVGTP